MSQQTEISTYSFLPWLRLGIGNKITEGDNPQNVKQRATIPITLDFIREDMDGNESLLKGVLKKIQIYGPGDIVGIDSRAVVKTEPHNWVTNFEPNYLPYIDFYDEDFSWRYTPAAPDNLGRLRPWIMLVVLKEEEFEEGTNIQNRPLPYIKCTNAAEIFPPADQLWAWAHVHVNNDLLPGKIISSDFVGSILPKLQDVLSKNPDLGYSRILCPRKLEENTPYHAFLMPVFESGRLAGLGLDPKNAPYATFSAWSKASEYPYYYRWYFRTGTVGDFEYLVRLLRPKPIDSRVGMRDIDVRDPGSNLQGITDSALGGVLKLGGALQIPKKTLKDADLKIVEKYEDWDKPYPHQFQKDLANFINLADEYDVKSSENANIAANLDDPDPLITPPLYGRWHALEQRLLKDREGIDFAFKVQENWLHELNLDPRFRATAGFGTQVVQTNQEKYMNAAWEQIGQVLEANRRIRLAQLAMKVSGIWYDRHILPIAEANSEKALQLTAPVHKRALFQGFTVHHHFNNSVVPAAAMSAAFRRIMRPGGRLMKLLAFDERVRPGNLVARINAGEVVPMHPKGMPAGAVSVNDLLEGLPVNDDLKYSSLEENQIPESVDRLPKNPKFEMLEPKEGQEGSKPNKEDSPDASKFKEALRDAYSLIVASREAAAQTPKTTLNLADMTSAILKAINPEMTIPRRISQSIMLPKHFIDLIGEEFKEAMAYPEFDIPMYEPLKDISSELFLPNINYVEQNSISILETNQRFIEAYMVGLNHEFARELLWREFPTDQRGSYFRQFWDVSSFLDPTVADQTALREKLKDIPPLDLWSRISSLESHDHRHPAGDKKEEAVLVIRGELLKKYPTAVIYAHKARWRRKKGPFLFELLPKFKIDLDKGDPANLLPEFNYKWGFELLPDCKIEQQDPGKVWHVLDINKTYIIEMDAGILKVYNGIIDRNQERRLEELFGKEADKPQDLAKTKIKFPLYHAKIDPDIYFLGFNLTADEARGGTGDNPDDEPGWFFVIKERPGEPRFGLDISQSKLNIWNDLSWEDVSMGTKEEKYIQITPPIKPMDPPIDKDVIEKIPQWNEDKEVKWDDNITSAHLAYILYQAPVMVAVHASEMLPPKEQWPS